MSTRGTFHFQHPDTNVARIPESYVGERRCTEEISRGNVNGLF